MLAFGVVMRNMVLSDIRLKFNYAVNPSFLLLTQFCVCVFLNNHSGNIQAS